MDNFYSANYNLFFLAAVFFLLGIILASASANILFVAAATLFLLIFIIFYSPAKKNLILFFIVLLIPAGFLYYYFHQNLPSLPLDIKRLEALTIGFVGIFQKLFTAEQAAFLAGIAFGYQQEFDPDFLNSLNASGTRHLVALSGLHFTIIVFALNNSLTFFFSKKVTFALTFIFVIFFLAITGFPPSAIRGALMSFLFCLASQIERLYSPRNAIAFAALFLVLLEPKILVFNIGFQLSFLATIGIIYLYSPTIKIFRISDPSSFLNWKKNLIVTTAAQLAIVPLLITQFNNFTLSSFISNLLILEFIPPLMILSYLLIIFYYLFQPLALLLSWLIVIINQYLIFIINFFGHFSFPLKISLSWPIIIFYYLCLIFLAYKYQSPKNHALFS